MTLVAGPVSLPTPHGVRRIDVRGAVAMRQVLWQAMGLDLQKSDALIMSAAVADHRPAEPSASKIKKSDERVSIDMIKNPDLLAEVGAARAGKRPVLVGFAVETERGEALLAYARRKLADKRVDLVVANEASDAFGREDNRATLVTAGEARELPDHGQGVAGRRGPRPRARAGAGKRRAGPEVAAALLAREPGREIGAGIERDEEGVDRDGGHVGAVRRDPHALRRPPDHDVDRLRRLQRGLG